MSDEAPAAKLVDSGKAIQTNGNLIDSFINRSKSNFIKALEIALDAVKDNALNEIRKPASESSSAALLNKVFVVHGHDYGLKTEMESFLHQVGLEPVVLHRQPDEGRTIIEKFEHHSLLVMPLFCLHLTVAYTIDQQTDQTVKDKKKHGRGQTSSLSLDTLLVAWEEIGFAVFIKARLCS